MQAAKKVGVPRSERGVGKGAEAEGDHRLGTETTENSIAVMMPQVEKLKEELRHSVGRH